MKTDGLDGIVWNEGDRIPQGRMITHQESMLEQLRHFLTESKLEEIKKSYAETTSHHLAKIVNSQIRLSEKSNDRDYQI